MLDQVLILSRSFVSFTSKDTRRSEGLLGATQTPWAGYPCYMIYKLGKQICLL